MNALDLSALIADTVGTMSSPNTPDFPHISYTQLGMFARCPKQYYYRYVLGIRQPPALPMAIGKGGHDALEQNGRHKIATKEDLPLTDLLDAASTAIDREVVTVEEKTDKEVGEAKDKVMANLTVYHHEIAPKTNPIGVEVEFNLDLNSLDEPDAQPIRILNGKVDIIAEDPVLTYNDDSLIRVIVDDYKWVSRKKSQAEVDYTKQLDVYLLFVKTLTDKYATRTRLMQMTPGNKSEPPGVVPIERDANLMHPAMQEFRFQRLREAALAMERSVARGDFIPVDDPMKCSWCGYRQRCQTGSA